MKKYIVIFMLMVFGWPLLPAFPHSGTILVVGLLLVLVGILLYRGDKLKEAWKEDEDEYEIFKQNVLDKIEKRKAELARTDEIKMPEMRANAESFLTQDQKAHLYMVSKNPNFKIDTKA